MCFLVGVYDYCDGVGFWYVCCEVDGCIGVCVQVDVVVGEVEVYCFVGVVVVEGQQYDVFLWCEIGE